MKLDYDLNRQELAMLDLVRDIALNIKEIKAILSKIPKTHKVPHDAPEPGGTFFIRPSIKTEYKSIQGKQMPMVTLLNYYLDWSEYTLKAYENNKDNLWNSALRTHLADCYMIVLTVIPTLQQNVKEIDWIKFLEEL